MTERKTADPATDGGFIELADDGVHLTCPMPADESFVEVRFKDGSTATAWYSCNIMDAGDWDFLPVKDGEPDDDANSIADLVAAWRPLPAAIAKAEGRTND